MGVDVELLKKKIDNKGFKLKHIANELGLTPTGFSLKLSKVTDFKVSEANKLSELLSLTKKERLDIFFNDDGHLK